MATMDQVFIRASKDEIEAIDAFVHIDGYISRSAWIRSHIRRVIDTRKAEIVFVSTLPRPADGQVVPVVTVRSK